MPGSIVRIARGPLAAAVVGLSIGGLALAQDTPPPTAAPSAAAPAPAVVAPAPPAAAPMSAARLDQLVAPLALYPDPLLAQILMAATYPLEVVEAARWVADPAHRALEGDKLVAAPSTQNWDPSVRALLAFPAVLATMSQKLQWTQDLGNAFLAQQGGVMDAVQRLRHRAMATGALKTTPQCDCSVEAGAGTVAIPPAEPEELRVPVYSPTVYGPWPDADYPPDAFSSPDENACPPGYWLLCYGAPVDLAFFGPLWGWSWIDWGHRAIFVRPRRHAVALAGRTLVAVRVVWVHDPAHRGAVRYADRASRTRFDAARIAGLTKTVSAGATVDAGTAVQRSDTLRQWAEQAGPVTVLRGAPAVFHEAAAARSVATISHGAAPIGIRPMVPRPPAAARAARMPHVAVAGPHGGDLGSHPR